MFGKSLYEWSSDRLLNYLDYLEFHAGKLEFLYYLSRIYDNSVENINPDYSLNHIKEIYPYSNYYYDVDRKNC